MGAGVHTLVQAADFERVLGTPSRARSPHFAVHHIAAAPLKRRTVPAGAVVPKLSTVIAPSGAESVDNTLAPEPAPPTALWLGTVVPKRHARRAVTRNLVKRQMRAAVDRHRGELPQGLWVLRLRTPFDRQAFPSAASDALRQAVRNELEQVLQRAAAR